MKNTLLIAFLFLPVNHLLAQEESLSGDWALRINQETGGKRNQDGLLKIQNENGKYNAYKRIAELTSELNVIKDLTS